MGESVYQSSGAELQLYSEDAVGAAADPTVICFSQKRQQQQQELLRLFSSCADVAIEHSPAAAAAVADEPLDFSTRKRARETAAGGSCRVAEDRPLASLSSSPRRYGCAERQVSLDSGIGDGCCLPPSAAAAAAIDIRHLTMQQQQQLLLLRRSPARHRTSSASPPTAAQASSAVASFGDDYRNEPSLSPIGGGGSVTADAFARGGDEHRAGAAPARAGWAAVTAAAGSRHSPAAGHAAGGSAYSTPSPLLPAEMQAAAAAGYGVSVNGALCRPSVWQMALNPVAAAAAAAAAFMQGDCDGFAPAAERSRYAAEPAANGRAAATAAASARLAAKAALLKEFGLCSISNSYYPPLSAPAGGPAGSGAASAAAVTPGASVAAAAAAAAAADYPLTVQAMRSQSEELFHMYKRQLLDSQDKQRRAVREAAARRLSAAPLRGARQRRQLITAAAAAAAAESADGGVPESSQRVGAAASLKDACSSTCSRSSLSSDGGEVSQPGFSTSATASPGCASNAGGSGNTACGGGSGDGSCDAIAADSTGRVESVPPAPDCNGAERRAERGSSPCAATAEAAQTSPSSRKRGRAALNEEQKDVAYWERRRKNNEAAKRSRDARRAKEDEIAIRAAFLEQENLRLRVDIASLKQEADKLRCLLYSTT